MGLEQKINYQLNKFPKFKKVIKRIYQLSMYMISPRIKSEGNIIKVSPDDPSHEYFFGYYDKSPWDASGRFIICMRARNTWSDVSPKESADILLIDTRNNTVRKVAVSHSWNVQQGCMAQWLGPDFSSRIIFNDFRDGKYVSIILNILDDTEQVIDFPVYSVTNDGKVALSLDFSRLYNLRPGYGYYNVPEITENIGLPDATAIWKIDIDNNKIYPLLSYKDFASFMPRSEMLEENAIHKVNHIMINPSGNRFMVLYRWYCGHRKYTRLITCDMDGGNMYLLSDDDMVSHCYWKDNNTILAFENKLDDGPGYYLMEDRTQNYKHLWPALCGDGHPSYSPDKSKVVTDTYPNRARVASILVMSEDDSMNIKTVARVFTPFKYDNDLRCDLHPRWSRDGKKICFDSVFQGNRGLYYIEL